MRKALTWIVIIAIVLLVGFRVVQRAGQRRVPMVEEKTKVPVKVMVVGRSSIDDILSFTGDVKGADQVNVYSEVPGKIIEYAVKEGEWITKDGLIATVDRGITGLDFEPAKVRSPISGVVGKTFLDKGDAVAPQIPVALVVRMDEVEVTVEIVERDTPRVRLGQKALVKTDAYPDSVFHGTLTSITPVVDPMSRTARARVTIDNKRGLLKPGMFARVDLIVGGEKNAVVIPADAVLGRTEFYTFVVENGKAAERMVDIGISEGDRAEVVKGLNVGDSLIVVGQRVVADSQDVTVITE